jgi:AcrR family transcriptional regulator
MRPVEASVVTRQRSGVREATPSAKLEGEKAQRIVAAMRQSVATRGAAASTFDVVAREAGVSRGLLHYYFGSKERLLVEVVRRDCDARVAALEERIEAARSVDEILQSLVQSLEAFVEDETATQAVTYEMISASRHSEEIRAELGELYRRWRMHLGEALRKKERDGVVTLEADAEDVASLLFALGDGMGLQLMADPEWESGPAFDLGVSMARRLLGG